VIIVDGVDSSENKCLELVPIDACIPLNPIPPFVLARKSAIFIIRYFWILSKHTMENLVLKIKKNLKKH